MFTTNQEYDRQELLDFVGSKQLRSGIIWGDLQPNCVIVTSGGSYGKHSGYKDQKDNDGSWRYIGQGSTGDQNIEHKANSLLAKKERNVLLFSTKDPSSKEIKQRGNRRKRYTFVGCFDVLSYEFVNGEDQRRNDKLIQFYLVPSDNVFNHDNVEHSVMELDLSLQELRQQIKEGVTEYKTHKTTIKEYKQRSAQVKAYALKRAKGKCERCGKPAPFLTAFGEPFLEVHHIQKLADDGPDLPENVCAICPNCHREAHYGGLHQEIKTELTKLIREKEEKLTKQ